MFYKKSTFFKIKETWILLFLVEHLTIKMDIIWYYSITDKYIHL